jgi:DNA-binding GntR family transcriptional regulator
MTNARPERTNGMRLDAPESHAPQHGESQSRTLALEVFEKLRADIVSSRLPPGMKLRFDDLRKTYGVGLSPLREALSRLAESRLVVATGQRGFRVPSVSVSDILDIAMVRKEVEGFALGLSIKKGDDAWEARVVGAHHKIALLDKSGRNVPEDVWESRHREFHYSLVSACDSPCLLHLNGLLTDLFDRYRRLSIAGRLPSGPRTLMHQKIVDAALSRNADLAVKLLLDHIEAATKLIVEGLSRGEERPKGSKAAGRKSRRA